MSRAASAAASLPLLKSCTWRTGPERSTGALSSMFASCCCSEIREQRDAQFIGFARKFSFSRHGARRARLDAAHAAFAIVIVDAIKFHQRFAVFSGMRRPDQAEVG